MRRRRQSGSVVVEFAMAGIPMIFVFISICEMARAMWTFNTLAYAANETAMYVSVHGTDCGSPNNCLITVANVATTAETNAIGLQPSVLAMTLTSPNSSYTCSPISNCTSNSTTFPPTADQALGTAIQVRLQYQYNSALAMLWTGNKPTSFATYNMGAYSKQRIVF